VKITQGKMERPAAQIRSRFSGDYASTDLQPIALLDQAKNDPDWKEVFRDEYFVVYAVIREQLVCRRFVPTFCFLPCPFTSS
jgi:hypothetical protein